MSVRPLEKLVTALKAGIFSKLFLLASQLDIYAQAKAM
jgi:hypothetical protein